MGYDLNKFADVQELPNHLRCLICNLVLAEPLQSPCDHYFCNQCITIHLQSTSHCPHYEEDSVSVKSDKKKSPLRKMSFRKIIGKSPKDKFPSLKLSDLKPLPDSVLAELNALKVLCDFSLNGCKESLTLANLNAHVKQCKFVDSKTGEQMSLENSEQPNSIQQQQQAVSTTHQHAEQQSAADREAEQTRVESSGESPNSDRTSDELAAMDAEKPSAEQRKDSEEVKSVNGEVKLVSEEEAGSDDFVVIPKAGGSSSTKSTESVQTNNSEPALLSSKENVNKEEDSAGAEKKKKKKKKKKAAPAAKTDADAVSLKEGDSGSHSEISGGSKAQSKESLVESEEVKRALREAETKSENLRTINSQLLGQIKKLKEEREEITKKLDSQLGSDEADALKNKIQLLEKENKQQALKIIQLLDNNEAMNKFIISLREEQSCLKAKYNATLSEVNQTLNRVKTCRQAN